ncbi:MAG: alginate lyase family protein [Bacteroidota bacterium]
MKQFFLSLACCFLIFMAKAQVVSLNTAELAKLKNLIRTDTDVQKHWQILLITANEALTAEPNPADTILTEGILQGDPRKTKTWKSLEDMQKVYALSLAYKVTGAAKYLNKANDFLFAWATHNQPQGNPINDTNLDRIIFAYDLLKTDLSADANRVISFWLNRVATQEMKTFREATANKGSRKSFNNWNSHRIKAIVQVATALADKKLENFIVQAYLMQISQNLKSDGSSFDFHERDALHYHIYDVDPLLVAATILNRNPKIKGDFYTYQAKEGRSLKKSVDWLVPYFTGEKTHAEWVNSKSAFDKKRAANGEKGYIAGTFFKSSEASSTIALAAYFDPKMLDIYRERTKINSKYPTWQFVLNEVRRALPSQVER